MKLCDCHPGDTVRIRHISSDFSLYWRLIDMGILPGCRAFVLGYTPFGDLMTVRIRDYSLSFRRQEAGKIEVERL